MGSILDFVTDHYRSEKMYKRNYCSGEIQKEVSSALFTEERNPICDSWFIGLFQAFSPF